MLYIKQYRLILELITFCRKVIIDTEMENKVKHLSPRLLPCIKPWLGPRGTVSRQLCPSLTIKMIVAGLVLVSIASVLSQDTPPPFRRIGCPAANLLAGDNYCFSPATNCLPNAIDHPDIPKNNNMYKVREPALNDGSLLGYIYFLDKYIFVPCGAI